MTVPRHSNRFGKSRRLVHTNEFGRVFGARRSAGDDCLVVYAKPNELGHSRLGLSIGKRAGNAVERNRIKRRLREAFRTSSDKAPEGFDIVVVARKTACKLSAADVESKLIYLVREACARWEK